MNIAAEFLFNYIKFYINSSVFEKCSLKFSVTFLFNSCSKCILFSLSPESYSNLICFWNFFHFSHQGNFIQNEIDLKTFVTLTSHDLIELGVKLFIERKRLILAINQLKSERFAFSFATAPGAERRSSSGIIQPNNWNNIDSITWIMIKQFTYRKKIWNKIFELRKQNYL